MKDPFSYGPQDEKVGQDTPSVSGGSTSELNRKELRRDIDRLLNP